MSRLQLNDLANSL